MLSLFLDCFVVPPRNDGGQVRHCEPAKQSISAYRRCKSPSFIKTKNKMTTAFPSRHFDRNTWSASGMYEVEKSVPPTRHCEPAKQSVPPTRHCEPAKQSRKRRNSITNHQLFNYSTATSPSLRPCEAVRLDCFVVPPRNDGRQVRHCEPAKQSTKKYNNTIH